MDGINSYDEVAQELKNIKTKIDNDQYNSINSYLLAYAIIRISGVIENEFKKCIFNKVTEDTREIIQEYFTKKLILSSRNPTTDNIIGVLAEFNKDWTKNFSAKTNDTIEKADLNSLVALRNSFAHGNMVDTSIENLIKYNESGFEIINRLRETISM